MREEEKEIEERGKERRDEEKKLEEIEKERGK